MSGIENVYTSVNPNYDEQFGVPTFFNGNYFKRDTGFVYRQRKFIRYNTGKFHRLGDGG